MWTSRSKHVLVKWRCTVCSILNNELVYIFLFILNTQLSRIFTYCSHLYPAAPDVTGSINGAASHDSADPRNGIARLWLEAESPPLPVVLYKLSFSAALIIFPLFHPHSTTMSSGKFPWFPCARWWGEERFWPRIWCRSPPRILVQGYW